MCAIIDANVAAEVFGQDRPEAGRRFFEWIASGGGRLVIGGQLRREIKNNHALDWIKQTILSGKIRDVSDDQVDVKANSLRAGKYCKSNDAHIVALAQLSGARLRYSNDRLLHKDFTNKQLIDTPRGKIYSTNAGGRFRETHKKLLRRRDLCAARPK